MKLQFKVQDHQTHAVDAVVDCFAGQPYSNGITYRVDPGTRTDSSLFENALRNAEIQLRPEQRLTNIQAVQRARGLTPSTKLTGSAAAPRAQTPNLDVEMETGTGKTYVYIKTLMEMHKRYGWSKYIIVVPSVAVREGVMKTFEITGEHFQQAYGTKPRAFVYNSSRLHEVERFSSDAGVQVMIINIQAFNSTSRDQRRIYDVLDDFQSRRPIDVIKANRPIVIIDEPQKISASKSLAALANFDALAVLRYSATHRIDHDRVHRLDAVDAYQQKLVKRIEVRGITVKALPGTSAYLYLESIQIAPGRPPRARLEIEVQTRTEIRRKLLWVEIGARLHELSNEIEAYSGLAVTDIDARLDIVELSNGDVLAVGQITQDSTEEQKRRIQIREVIAAHLANERELHPQGIKVLSLFFIDEVVKYRDYDRGDTLGEYARIFLDEYREQADVLLGELSLEPGSAGYAAYLKGIDAEKSHNGYFSIDRKGRLVDGERHGRGDEVGQSKDVAAYDLILRNKERLLSLDEPTRFIFSHSALREGWDNPNVFVMGMLKKSDNTVTRRQEVGRGLRLAVNQHGERVDDPAMVHEINRLTVVTDESYLAFVKGLQNEIRESLSERPRKATPEYFVGRTFTTEDGPGVVDEVMANLIYKHLVRNEYLKDEDDTLADAYFAARDAGTLATPGSEVLKPLLDHLWAIVDGLDVRVPAPVDGRRSKTLGPNANFHKREFQELWQRINHKAVYQVDFDSAELVNKCVAKLDANLRVASVQYVVETGRQLADMDEDDLAAGRAIERMSSRVRSENVTASSRVVYDLLGEIAEKTQLTRRTVAGILRDIRPATYGMFRLNPERFIVEASRLVNEEKAAMVVESIGYDTLNSVYDRSIFTANHTGPELAATVTALKRHIYDYALTDSQVERRLVQDLEVSAEVCVYAKLPRGFVIPTPVGDYSPDWAIAFNEGSVRHIYFVAETKGSLASLQLRPVEKAKIDCARRFFEKLTEKSVGEGIHYGAVTSYEELLNLVTAG